MKRKQLTGISQEAEERNLQEILGIAKENLHRTENFLVKLKEDMEDIWQNYEVSDKETLVLFNTAEAQYQETLKDLSRRERARKKPYFGRIVFSDPDVGDEESYYIGRVGIAEGTSEPVVIDWRAPIASVYYDGALGRVSYEVNDNGARELDLKRKRTYEIKDDTLITYYDSDVVATDELLTKYLSQNKKAVLGEIIATIQQEQNAIIRKSPRLNVIVQGVAGSGKTTVAMHRISYILYNYEEEFRPEDFYIIGSNRILLNYITSVLPDLDVYGVKQMTMEQLFVRLLYDAWDKHTYRVKPLNKAGDTAWKKGTEEWFADLKFFCEEYERVYFGDGEVVLEETGGRLMSPELLASVLTNNKRMSMAQKAETLNERLVAAVENEIQGKGHTFPKKERERLLRFYGAYYGKSIDKLSVYELYEEFLDSQWEMGKEVEDPQKCFDVYDLAALAYLYRRLIECDPIREASHVVIDEAQDFGMMVYEVMHFCLKDCTYTIMGDVSQNIHEGYGLSDWNGIRELFLTGDYDCFETLKKSYRNTVEISEYASDILAHGSFEIYPAEPVLRHGNPVEVKALRRPEAVVKAIAERVQRWQENGLESIAIICKNDEEAGWVRRKLAKEVPVVEGDYETMEFQTGVMVLPIFYTKGLEFDGVILYCPTKEHYPAGDGSVKLLYVAATRALHELCVIYAGDLSDILSHKSTNHNRSFQATEGSRLPVYEKPKELKSEKFAKDVKATGEERARRGYIGPKQIRTDDLKPKDDGPVTFPEKKRSLPNARPVRKKMVADVKKSDAPINPSPYAFYTMPDATAIAPQGHTKGNQSVRMVIPTKKYVECISAYGTLRLTPISGKSVRVQFVRSGEEFYDGQFARYPVETVNFKIKQEPKRLIIQLQEMSVSVDKQSGAVSFSDAKGNILLSEEKKEPRQLERLLNRVYFAFDKKEKLKAQGVLKDDLRPLSGKAYYISFGQKPLRQAQVVSDKGYRILCGGEASVLFCGTGVYGCFIQENPVNQVDYCFQIEESLLS
ncbi:DNA helicase-2 / ATP-dependent DNA helicase PcrA [Lachnospiraceae bacterium XBB1006]|nr:DNA helicase-2 / ATP-dependent DNA helicase PcrA [Lachnospiraceae bacterium XBB1006]